MSEVTQSEGGATALTPFFPGARNAFEINKYPDLAAVVREAMPLETYREIMPFFDLGKALSKELNREEWNDFRDLHGQNILQQTLPDGSHRYVIIDMQDLQGGRYRRRLHEDKTTTRRIPMK